MYTHVSNLVSFKTLKINALNLFVETMSSFFGCNLKLYHDPQPAFLEKFGIDILANPERGTYKIDGSSIVILGRITQGKDLLSAVGFIMTNVDPTRYSKLFTIVERVLSKCLTEEINNGFKTSMVIFGDEFLKRVICQYISSGHYNVGHMRHLLEYFFKLRTTSFEGKYFSTGAIISKSQDFYNGTFDGKRFGVSKKLNEPFSIQRTNNIDKRIWYLVDGRTSFFLGTKNLLMRDLFILDKGYSDRGFLDAHSLALTLKGGDFLIKIESEKILTIIASDGSEFTFFENKWKFRNYSVLKQLLIEKVNASESVINSLLFYVLNCSKNQISTIIWVPRDLDNLDDFINPETKNNFLTESLDITDNRIMNHLFRCFSSDGVNVITRDGKLKYFGVIVNINQAAVKGITGTGETAASVISNNGLSIKVSQDGAIKIFLEGSIKPYYF